MFLEHLRSDPENIIDFLSMDRWLKSGSLKETVKTSVTVAPLAVEASTTNRYVQILCEMQLFYVVFIIRSNVR